MANCIKELYAFDMMEKYPADNIGEEYIREDVEVYYGSHWCNCYNRKKDYSDHWTIIEA